MIGTRLDDKSSGGYVASSYRLLFQAVTAANSARSAEAYRIPLTNQLEFQNFSNTVQYGPAMYAPQAAALALARIAKMTALQSFYLARFFNGFAALTVGFFAVHIATRGRFIIFTLLTMPTSFYLMGSLSQDALLLAGSALFWSIVSNNLSTGRIPSPSIILGLVALLVVLSCGRLPYIALAVVFFLKPFRDMRWRGRVFQRWPGLAAIALAITLALVWVAVIRTVYINWAPAISAQNQITFLLSHIVLIPWIAIHSFQGPNFFFAVGGIFGSIGLLNSKLPLLFYPIALIGTLAAIALDMTESSLLAPLGRMAVMVGLLLGVGAVYFALYLTFAPVGHLAVLGMHGRYFIPFIIGLVFVLPTATLRVRKFIRPLVLLLPLIAIIGFGVSMEKVKTQFYPDTNCSLSPLTSHGVGTGEECASR